jgi:hypothetical protein
MHIETFLPQRIEIGAIRAEDWETVVVRTDGGREVRNNRIEEPTRTWEVPTPVMKRDDADYLAIRALYSVTEGLLHSFNLNDPDDETDTTLVAVRFDTPLRVSYPASDLVKLETFTLIEVKGIVAS